MYVCVSAIMAFRLMAPVCCLLFQMAYYVFGGIGVGLAGLLALTVRDHKPHVDDNVANVKQVLSFPFIELSPVSCFRPHRNSHMRLSLKC